MVVGGWETFLTSDTHTARWFSLVLTEQNAPWAFWKGEPFKTIASLEMMASLIALRVFGRQAVWAGGNCSFGITSFTDNQSCGFVVDKLMTTSFPLCLVLIQLCDECERLGVFLDLSWIPREQNVEADALTNGEFHNFDPSNRVEVSQELLGFDLLNELMEFSSKLYLELEAGKKERASRPKVVLTKAAKVPVTKKLCWAQPW